MNLQHPKDQKRPDMKGDDQAVSEETPMIDHITGQLKQSPS